MKAKKRKRLAQKNHRVGGKSSRFFISALICFSSLYAKGRDSVPEGFEKGNHFSWTEHNKLSWNDFKGPPDTMSNESAAATCCSIGLQVRNDTTGHPGIIVSNKFYVNGSWVKDDARIGSVLAHEQGHFDLCELYTRKLRLLAGRIDINSPNLKEELTKTYALFNDEYETRQQAYEQETSHGTIIPEQTRWQVMISEELDNFSKEQIL